MSDPGFKIRRAQSQIEVKAVARMIMDFHDEFRGIYPDDVMASVLCAVGPLQSMIGLAINKGRLSEPPVGHTFVPTPPHTKDTP